MYLLCAVGLFTYQTLDAMDGKQCTLTDTDGPLPEFFDHGADALSNLLVTVCIGSAIGLNKYPGLSLLIIATQLALFYCYHWQTYVSGIVIFKRFVSENVMNLYEKLLYSVDVTEAQYTVIGLHMATFFYGTDMWETKVGN